MVLKPAEDSHEIKSLQKHKRIMPQPNKNTYYTKLNSQYN